MFSIKQPHKNLPKYLKKYKKIITIEEQNLPGGIGTIIAEIIAENNINVNFTRLGITDKYILKCGNREWLQAKYGLDERSLYTRIKKIISLKI